MKKLFKNEKGNILVMSAGSMVAVMIMAAFAIDMGGLLTARNQLQCAVDAAALSGVSGLVISQEEATSRALLIGNRNTCVEQPVQLISGDIIYPNPSRIQVTGNHTVNLFFARAFGFNSSIVTATAVAETSNLDETNGARPWALPDMGWPTGEIVTIKSGVLGAPATNAGFFYPVDYPPLNKGTPISGASVYEENIFHGSPYDVAIDDILVVEPGNMIGPTRSGVTDLIALDPEAYWDGSQVVNSSYAGNASPRIIKIPLYDPDFPPDSGKNTVVVIGLAAFFLTGFQGQNVEGVFMYMVTNGSPGPGYSFLQGIRLIQ